MEVNILGIVDDILYIAPFYAGDHYHQATLSDYDKQDFLLQGIPEYPDVNHIEAQLHGLSHEDFIKMLDAMNQRKEFLDKLDNANNMMA